MSPSALLHGTTAGAPWVAIPPPEPSAPPRLIISWHLMDPPRSERAMAAALPLAGLPAWRVYVGLPMSGARAPQGGPEEFYRLASEDYVLNVAEPVTEQAAAELPALVAELRERFSVPDTPIGVVGGSAGATIALEASARHEVPIGATALVSPVVRLADAVAANERRFGVSYPWGTRSRAVADEFDFVRRAEELPAPTLLVVGEHDEPEFRTPAAELRRELGTGGHLVTVPGMAHALAEEPGLEPAEQTPAAAVADAEITAWFRRFL